MFNKFEYIYSLPRKRKKHKQTIESISKKKDLKIQILPVVGATVSCSKNLDREPNVIW